MPAAGPSELTVALLGTAVNDMDTVNRFRRKCAGCNPPAANGGPGPSSVVLTAGSGGEVDGQDAMVIARRFAWALEFGVDDLLRVPVLGHRCDPPLSQRIDVWLVCRSSQAKNQPEWAARRYKHRLAATRRPQRPRRHPRRQLIVSL